MKEIPTINPKTGKPFPEKFIAKMKQRAQGINTPEERQKMRESNKRTMRQKQTFQSVARMLLEMAPTPDVIEKIKEYLPGLDDKQITNRLAMTQKMVEKAIKGDGGAFQVLRDTAGEKPVEKQEITGAVANTYTQVDKKDFKSALIEAKKILNELE